MRSPQRTCQAVASRPAARLDARPALSVVAAAACLPGAAAAQEAAAAGSGAAGNAALDWLDRHLHLAGRLIEAAGIGVIVVGVVLATGLYFAAVLRSGGSAEAFQAYRANLGRGILLGLELLVAADIIGTVAVDPTLYNLGVLAAIVLIRTFLSFSLEVEIEGRWPWRQEAGERRCGGEGERT